MTYNQKLTAGVFLVLIAMFYIIGMRLEGFLLGHLGWAGPHLLSTSLNMLQSPLLAKTQLMFSNDLYSAYNHHPSLYFLVLGVFTNMFDTIQHKLMFGYLFSATFWAAGLTSVFALLRYFKVSLFISLFVLASAYFATFTKYYTYLIDYSGINVLFSSLFIYYAYSYLKGYKSIKPLYIVSIVAILTSWYMVVMVAAFGGMLLLKHFILNGIKDIHKTPIFKYCAILATLTGLQFILLSLQTAAVTSLDDVLNNFTRHFVGYTGNKPVTWDAFKVFFPRYTGRTHYYMVPLLIVTGLTALYYLPFKISLKGKNKSISVAVKYTTKKFKNFKEAFLFNKEISYVLFSVFVGSMAYYLKFFHWSNAHPFIFFWMIPVYAIFFAMILEHIKTKVQSIKNVKISRVILAVLSIYAVVSFKQPIKKAVENYNWFKSYSNGTQGMLEGFQKISENKPSVVEITKNTCGGNFNAGRIFMLSAHPNRAFKGKKAGYNHVQVSCDSDNKGTLTFTIKNVDTGKKGVFLHKI